MRKKFKVYYGADHSDPEKAGTRYKPSGKDMLVMNDQGIFFLYHGEQYYPWIQALNEAIGNYDVRWIN